MLCEGQKVLSWIFRSQTLGKACSKFTACCEDCKKYGFFGGLGQLHAFFSIFEKEIALVHILVHSLCIFCAYLRILCAYLVHIFFRLRAHIFHPLRSPRSLTDGDSQPCFLLNWLPGVLHVPPWKPKLVTGFALKEPATCRDDCLFPSSMTNGD